MRYLGLDLGTRTLGIAISDRTGLIASTYKTLRFPEGEYMSTISELQKICEEEKIDKIVLGLPRHMNYDIGEKATIATNFGEYLSKELNIEVIMQDERLTTVEATHYMLEGNIRRAKRKEKIDSLAANIILQTYLDRKRNEK